MYSCSRFPLFIPTKCTYVNTYKQIRLFTYIYIHGQILEKKWEYNEEVHQLFTDFKKAYDSVRREVLYNILIEFGIPMKLVRLTKKVSE